MDIRTLWHIGTEKQWKEAPNRYKSVDSAKRNQRLEEKMLQQRCI